MRALVFGRPGMQTLKWPANPLGTHWPQAFYVSGYLVARDAFEVRPLTVTGLLKGVGRNFAVMAFWRVMVLLRILGFLKTPELEPLSWRHLTLRVRRYQMWYRLYPVRLYRRLTR